MKKPKKARKPAKSRKKAASKDFWGEIKVKAFDDLFTDKNVDVYGLTTGTYGTITGTCPSLCSSGHGSGTIGVACC